ncbi:MAG: TetR family transcriptional regulator [Chitinivibrionales bacterium]|nr:TetR family transcriptional regulator [Chitinivibrionales bacterium]MBD3397040.1 TetR family transcriptional regulator [Chitinivibrionales bacterium]
MATCKKRDSAVTRARILSVAERLFAENGFDGTRVDDIAENAGVNKALIYYYFKSKDAILDALFTSAIQEVIQVIVSTYDDMQLQEDEIERIFDVLVDLIGRKKRIVAVMLMESLKASNEKPHLFKIADYFIGGEVETLEQLFKHKGHGVLTEQERKQMLVTEFFTGIMPMINYVVYSEHCQKHFGMTRQELRSHFLEAFKMTHVAYHMSYLKRHGVNEFPEGHINTE